MPEQTPQTPQAGEELGPIPQAAPPAEPLLVPSPRFVKVIRVLTLVFLCVFTLTVTGIGFALSFSGLFGWAGQHDYEGWQRWAWPITVDAGILIGELALFAIALDGIRARGRKLISFDMAFFFALVAGGWTASLAFNILHHGGGPGSHVSAAFPPALAMIGLFVFLRTVHRYTSGDHAAMMQARTRADTLRQREEERLLSERLTPSGGAPQLSTEPPAQLPAQPERPEEPEAEKPDPDPEPDPDPTPDPQGPGGAPLPDLSDPGGKKVLVLSALEEERGHVSRAIETVRESAPEFTVSEGYTHQIKREEWLPAKLAQLLAEAGGEEPQLRELITSGRYAISEKALTSFLAEQPRGEVRLLRVAGN